MSKEMNGFDSLYLRVANHVLCHEVSMKHNQ